jgi:A/G-specific adenine glycosylase
VLKRSFFVNWLFAHGRDFPWRREGVTPFALLITEMLLRQTRASEVAKLWDTFFIKYPDAQALAVADVDEVASLISILGFGKMRSSALVFAAQWLVTYHGGQVPENAKQLTTIPHVGSYAAHAVLCFGFGHKVEIVDVNVLRFFARFYGLQVKADIRRNPHVVEIARKALPKDRRKAREHNYGILDFTADICKSRRPRCEICPLINQCEYGKSGNKVELRKREI